LANPAGSLSVPDAVSSAVILGGVGAVPDGIEAALVGLLGDEDVVRKGGSDRYGTAAIVGAWSTGRGMHWEGAGITTGRNFADALAGGAMLGKMRSVMLLTAPDALPAATRAPLSVNKQFIQTVHFIGGTAAISAGVREDVMAAIE
ncbi:cell wall-binding repeat-containing protein, partial [bacterium]|nr:cell wall-binding repeat-containing protein [bacterium]